MSDGVEIEVVDPGSGDDPFASQPDPLASAKSSEEDEEEDGQDEGSDSQDQTDEDEEDDEDAVEYSAEELVALEELQAWREEQAATASEAAVSKLQSKYDRQLAAQQRQLRDLATAAEARETELREAVREAKLNGLSDAEKEQLKRSWDEEDKVAKLNAYEQQLTGFHVELLRTAYATEYAEFGLQAEDLEQFDTPEEMEAFIKDVQIEYYKLMATPGIREAVAEGEKGKKPAAPATAASAARRTPAGASAPTDAGGGSAPPPSSKFNKGTGMDAMAENIRGGWESPRVR